MEHPLELSARVIDSGSADQPTNRITQELSELGDGVALVESFSHSIALRTGEGLLVVDASGVATGPAVVEALRTWSSEPVSHVLYTHGHVDHVGGSGAFVADAERRAQPRPRFVAHRAVAERFDRYRRTDGWNLAINARQFGWLRSREFGIGGGSPEARFLPGEVAEPDDTFDRYLRLDAGGIEVELHHERGETDDHTWAWLPGTRTICCGDFLIWNFPNAGNPQKVQRYPDRWAAALRAMVAKEADLLIPSHGLPIAGSERIALVLGEVAGALEQLVADVVAAMNAGATLDEIVHSVHTPSEVLERPWLQPLYDEPEFVVRNIWRLYGGWWDGNPARLKPPADASVAELVAGLAGGPAALMERAEGVAGDDLRLACQLAEWAHQAAPGDARIAEARRRLYRERSDTETSLMAKGIFRSVRDHGE